MYYSTMIFLPIVFQPVRAFHNTPSIQQRPSHRLYGKIDWDKVESGLYAIVDPFDPNHILYISEYDYIIQVRVCYTNNKPLIVLATPDDKRDSPSTQTAPAYDPFVKDIIVGNQKPGKRRGTFLSHLFSSPFIGWRSRKDGKEESMVRLNDRNVKTCVSRWYDVLSWWRRGSLMSNVAQAERDTFARRLQSLLVHNGIQFLILYLKASLFIVNSYLAGRKLTCKDIPGKVFVRCVNGLPWILPLYARNSIRSGNTRFIHIWTSVLNMYKGIEGKYDKISISSITQDHPDFTFNKTFHAFTQFVQTVFWQMVRDQLRGNILIDFTIKSLFTTSKAGPAHQNSMLGAARDASVWFKVSSDPTSGFTSNILKEWLLETGNVAVWKIFRTAAKRYDLMSSMMGKVIPRIDDPKFIPHNIRKKDKNGQIILVPAKPGKIINPNLLPLLGIGRLQSREGEVPPILGRLSPIYEPAGKIRIVAIVDYWTNAVLKPLHDWMFDILKVIPTDATFSQEETLKAFASKGFSDCWSIDLTAATDTIPLKLYQSLLTPILGTKMVALWSELLVGRNFLHVFAPNSEREFTYQAKSYDLARYRRGQPMGALSSWGAMALCHHALVQFAAFSVNREFLSSAAMQEYLATALPNEIKDFEWYQDYLVLGDDLVIFCEKVAKEYLRLSNLLGVEVGMTKSFISEKGFMNFASQSYVGDVNLSPISFKEFVGVDSLSQRAELSLRMGRRGWIDFASCKWLAPLVKTFFNNDRLWTVVQRALREKRTHPLVSWILSVLLVPGRNIVSAGLPRVSIRAAVSVMKSAVIWNKPLQDFDTLSSNEEMWGPIVKILKGNVDNVYRDFLMYRKRLEYFETWLQQTMSVESEEILKITLFDQVKLRMEDWIEKYRIPLKTAQVTFGLPALKPWMVEDASGMTLDHVVNMIADAGDSLPNVPDYEDLEFITKALERASGNPDRELVVFERLMRMVGVVDHLHEQLFDRNKRSKDLKTPINHTFSG